MATGKTNIERTRAPKPGRKPRAGLSESKADAATRMIRDRILDLTYAPGSRLHDPDLMEQLSLGRTPVREAINRLAAEGLVEITANQAPTVKPLDFQEILQLFEAYRAISQLTAAYIDLADPGLRDDIARMQDAHREAIRASKPLDVSHWNYAVHLRLIESSRNHHLITACQRIHNQARRLNTMVYSLEAGKAEYPGYSLSIAERQHDALLGAIDSGDRNRISDVLDDHALTFRSRFVHMIEGGNDNALRVLRHGLPGMSAPSERGR